MKTYLKEKIGNTELFTGRKKELAKYLEWADSGLRKQQPVISISETP